MRYRERGVGRTPVAGVELLDSPPTVERSSDDRLENERLPPGDGEEAGNGVDTPRAFASFANLWGARGVRGVRRGAAVPGFRGDSPATFGRFGMAGAVNDETYSAPMVDEEAAGARDRDERQPPLAT